LRERAIRRGSRSVNTPSSRTSARLVSVTRWDHRFRLLKPPALADAQRLEPARGAPTTSLAIAVVRYETLLGRIEEVIGTPERSPPSDDAQ
jgi:hypothetical protein